MILSSIYLAITSIRNWMFDRQWLEERTFQTPTICIGNLAVGGTGKTPHTELFVEWLLENGLHTATLSRGYGRKTKGYHEVKAGNTAEEVGDEPLQMFTHFEGKVPVTVCEDRRKGIEQIEAGLHPDVIILDDAFQHRYVKPTVRILLTDYARLYCDDSLLPYGRLRESRKGARRADIIIVTKCPSALTTEESEKIVSKLHPLRQQKVYFSTIDYIPISIESPVVLITGIAQPKHLLEQLQREGIVVQKHLSFPDHHAFTAKELKCIEEAGQQGTTLLTTAKDFSRLQSSSLSPETIQKIKIQQISPRILFGVENDLKQTIINHVRKNTRNCSVD